MAWFLGPLAVDPFEDSWTLSDSGGGAVAWGAGAEGSVGAGQRLLGNYNLSQEIAVLRTQVAS